MMRPAIAAAPFAALLMAGCTPAMPDDEPLRPAPPLAQCDADGVQGSVGAQATADLGAQLQDRTGATRFRWGPPGALFTKDYRQDRLNVMYDADMRITRIYCG
jgi:hypothetical protein